MSAYTTVRTRLVSAEHLAMALRDMGFPEVEVFETAQPLVGFEDETRPQSAELIVRKEHVGEASNDIGFRRLDDGTFEAVISDFDRATFNLNWLQQLSQRYAYHVATEQLRTQGFELVHEEVAPNQEIRLTLRRMS